MNSAEQAYLAAITGAKEPNDVPDLAQIPLGFLRNGVFGAQMKFRQDIQRLLVDTAKLPDSAIVQITMETCGILVDDEGHVLKFA